MEKWILRFTIGAPFASRKRTLAPWMGLLLTILGAFTNGLPFTGFPPAPVPWISLLLSLMGFFVVLFG
ncbi:MAG TPA: hypothetical protein VK578_00750, partial [Edaphobacter sp.]|nr:hypothetical protein [Edaphobacter sp.]